MKLRLQKNSIRLRLSPNEISRFQETGVISEEIQFHQSQKLTCTLKTSNHAKNITADFTDQTIAILISFDTARNWTETNLVGLEYEQRIDEISTLKITIEKDFAP